MADVAITPIGWGDELRAGLGDTVRDDADEFECAIAFGGAQGWRVGEGDMYLVTRVDVYIDHSELVVMALRGRNVRAVLPRIYGEARRIGCTRVRWHTKRPGVARLVATDYPVREIERVYAVDIEP